MSSQSKYWRKFAGKVNMRCFIKLYKNAKHYPLAGTCCWTGYEGKVENYTHALIPFWEEVRKILKYIFDLKEPLKLETASDKDMETAKSNKTKLGYQQCNKCGT